jgi:DNA-binding beta-propeller fold protein YncE
MKLAALSVAALAFFAAIAAGGAGANGSPFSPGLVYGGDGVASPRQDVRYVTLGTERSTLVSVIRTAGGRVMRSRSLRGHYGIPLVAYDGTAGGLSGNGKRLLVATYGPPPGSPGMTRFAVLDTKSLRVRRLVRLSGSYSFDAISPDASILYLTQHVRAGKHPVYRVRTYDVRSGVLRGAIVDRLEDEEDMGGEPVTRASSADGRWAYTLYARRGHEPFVHALDTAEREAFCIDLPLELGYNDQWGLRLELHERSERLSVGLNDGTLATIDTGSWEVERSDR